MYLELGAAVMFGVLWTLSYISLKAKWNIEPEWSCRTVTAIHAATVTSLAGLAWYLGPSPFTDPGGVTTFSQKLALTVSLGYFLFDMGWCIVHQTEGITMMLHHMCSIAAIGRVLVNGLSGTEATAGLFCLEITNPFLQARWMLRSAGYKDTLLHTITELVFMILFIFFRMIWGTYLCYTTVMHPRPHREAKLFAMSFYMLSWVFMLHITRYFVAKYIDDRRTRQFVMPVDETDAVPSNAFNSTVKLDNLSVPSTSSEEPQDLEEDLTKSL